MAKKYAAIKDPKPTVIIIRCSDPRFRIAFRDFTAEELELKQGEFVPINVAGGPAALAHKILKFFSYWFLRLQVRFFLSHFKSIKKVIIIGHQDCGYYKTIFGNPKAEKRERRDLPKAAEVVSKAFGIKVEAYYASFAAENRESILFERVL